MAPVDFSTQHAKIKTYKMIFMETVNGQTSLWYSRKIVLDFCGYSLASW